MFNVVRSAIVREYGTHRGYVRLLLARAEYRLGLLSGAHLVDWARARRLVFVCQGNIMRSAYAEALAQTRGVASASFGLATTTGVGAHTDAIAYAARKGIDLSRHTTTDISDFELRAGDVVLVMEARQFKAMRRIAIPDGAMLTILGIWGGQDFPHLHDPNTLRLEYLETCFSRIERAVDGVVHQLIAARPSLPSAEATSRMNGPGSSIRNT